MISWTSFGNPLNQYQPIRKLVLYYYGNVMNRLLRTELEKRFTEYKEERASGNTKRSKPVISLTLDSYCSSNAEAHTTSSKLNEDFVKHVIY